MDAELQVEEADFRPKKKILNMDSHQAKIIGLSIATLIFVILSMFSIAVAVYHMNGDVKDDGETVQGYSPTFKYKTAAVASDNTNCSRMGADILKQGGNAVDAAVTVSICLGVLQPFASGIGGGGIALVYNKETGKTTQFDFREIAPGAANKTMFEGQPEKSSKGGLAVAIPGEIAGLYTMWEKHGKLAWKTIVTPTINLAKQSYVGALLAKQIYDFQDDIVGKTLGTVFAPNGQILVEGDVLKQPTLAATLQKLADDPSSFYVGAVADDLVADIKDNGGIITNEDLLYYWSRSTSGERNGVREPSPLSVWYSGYEVIGAYPPISGGSCLALSLNLLEPYNFAVLGNRSALAQHYLVESWKWAFADRSALGDPKFVNCTPVVEGMLSKKHAAVLRQQFSSTTTYPPAHYVDLNKAETRLIDDHGTSHLSVVDEDGNAVSLTSTVNLEFGSKVLSVRTGIVLNDEMDDFSSPNQVNEFGLPPSEANYIAPFKKPLSSMTPTIVLLNDELYMVVGGSGGPKIITATSQVLLNVISFNMTIGDAISRPRCHDQLTGPTSVEHDYSKSFVSFLEATNHDVVVYPQNKTVGCVQGIVVTQDGLEAASDWRKKGTPSGY